MLKVQFFPKQLIVTDEGVQRTATLRDMGKIGRANLQEDFMDEFV